MNPEIGEHAPANATSDHQRRHHGTDHGIALIRLQASRPETESGVVEGADAVEHRGPEALAWAADVGEAEGIEQHRANQHQHAAADHDGPEGGTHAAHSELIEGAALVDALTQTRAALHKALQESTDGHQSQAAGDDQGRQHQLPEEGQLRTHINDREARHRDGGGGGEQGFPEVHRWPRT